MPRDGIDAVYVVDREGRLHGRVPLRALIAGPGDLPVAELVQDVATVRPETDQELVALSALRHQLASVPVVDALGKLVGVVPPVALLSVLHREHVEDLHRLVGLRREGARARHALDAPPRHRARDRLPWLLVGLGVSLVGAWVVARFEGVLRTEVAVAFFLPTIVYLADAIGTQTETIVVRGLSHRHARFGRLLVGEVRTGALIGAVLALLLGPVVLLTTGQLSLAVAVGLAVLATGTLATGIGLTLPWTLSRLGRDPAFGSGPVATVVQDVLSLLVYLLAVSVLLG